mmetsp:Transcript_10880/g.40569  ORF Transcript_10880/g.40569 Transcript_10880/m.40569 type:complete len:311 (+) Transcript_10880:2085-3017(+)
MSTHSYTSTRLLLQLTVVVRMAPDFSHEFLFSRTHIQFLRRQARSSLKHNRLFNGVSLTSPHRAYTIGPFHHQETIEDNIDTPFDFTKDNYKKVEKILAKYPTKYKRSAILPLLHLAQEQDAGWLKLGAMNKVAEICHVHPMAVYECATFYSMYNRRKVGKYHLLVCKTTPCQIRGCDVLIESLSQHLGIRMFETTEDGLFTLGEMECLGACVNAPMIAIADYSNAPHDFTYDYYEDLTPKKLLQIVEAFRRGEKPTPGPQNGRKGCEPLGGKTSLNTPPRGPCCLHPDLNPEIKKQKEAEEAAKKQESA